MASAVKTRPTYEKILKVGQACGPLHSAMLVLVFRKLYSGQI